MLGLLGRAKKFITGKKQAELIKLRSSNSKVNPSAIIIRPRTNSYHPTLSLCLR